MSEQSRKYRVRKADYADGAVTEIVLTNPDKHNCFDDELIEGLTGAFMLVGDDPETRAVVLRAEGKSFSAGADLNWMKRMAENDEAANQADAEALASLMHTINVTPKPVIGLVQGAAYGGGVGLSACCDITVATERASFCLSEVKLGLIPSAISPYVVAAIGARAARRWWAPTRNPFSARCWASDSILAASRVMERWDLERATGSKNTDTVRTAPLYNMRSLIHAAGTSSLGHSAT